MNALEDERRRLQERHELYEKAERGEKPLCPKCHSGHILNEGKYFFYCNNPECNAKAYLDPAKEKF